MYFYEHSILLVAAQHHVAMSLTAAVLDPDAVRYYGDADIASINASQV
jgi:hypothetical protein